MAARRLLAPGPTPHQPARAAAPRDPVSLAALSARRLVLVPAPEGVASLIGPLSVSEGDQPLARRERSRRACTPRTPLLFADFLSLRSGCAVALDVGSTETREARDDVGRKNAWRVGLPPRLPLLGLSNGAHGSIQAIPSSSPRPRPRMARRAVEAVREAWEAVRAAPARARAARGARAPTSRAVRAADSLPRVGLRATAARERLLPCARRAIRTDGRPTFSGRGGLNHLEISPANFGPTERFA
jgi:hypothetical protein